MYQKILALVVLTLFMLSLAVSGCGGGSSIDDYLTYSPEPEYTDDTQPDDIDVGTAMGALTTGELVEAASQSIPVSGGTITVSEPGSPIDGLQIAVPSGAFSSTGDFTVAYADIGAQTFGDYVNPVSPLITVEGPAAYSEEIMNVTVPVAVPEGQFAMGFIYDEEAGKLQGMNTVAQDDDSMTLAVRHFCKFFISSIDINLLDQDIDSGYQPGVDDWQFVNNGSFIEKGGHCAGQSVTSLWYFLTRPDGPDADLYGRYDNNGNQPATPAFQPDDNLAYRLASVIQHDIKWKSFENKFWTNLAGQSDNFTWGLFAYSMLLTGEPQEVGIFSQAGGGHDMVCYRVNNHQLYIADPNYPGNTERRIEFNTDNGTFKPYNSGANAEEIKAGNGKAYETIEYCAKTTTINWSTIAARWNEFKAGTIGNDVFPAYKMVYRDAAGTFHDLADGYVSGKKMFSMGAKAVNAADVIHFRIYRDGVQLTSNAKVEYELKLGINNLGIEVLSPVDAKDKDGNAIKVDKFVDFKYFRVIYDTLSIQQSATEGEPGLYVDFTALVNNAPDGAVFKWSVDGSSQQESTSVSFSYMFEQSGVHNISVNLIDADGKQISTATTTVTIGATTPTATDYSSLTTLDVTINLWGWWVDSAPGYDETNSFSWIMDYDNVAWSGNFFTAGNAYSSVSGSVSPDGIFSATISSTFSDDEGSGETRINAYDLKFFQNPGTEEWRAQVYGPAAQNNIDVYSFSQDAADPPRTRTLDHLAWDKGEQYYSVSFILYHPRSSAP